MYWIILTDPPPLPGKRIIGWSNLGGNHVEKDRDKEGNAKEQEERGKMKGKYQ